MNRFLTIAALLVSLLGLNAAFAGGLTLNKHDCEDILRRWAADPTLVPQALVDACKEVLAAESVVPNPQPAAAATDPCAAPGAADSVQCWGPWASLAPAAGPAGGPIVLADGPNNLRPDQYSGNGPGGPEESPLPLASCTPGAGCGFATVAPGLVAQPADTSASQVVPYAMAADGSQFTVDPGGSGELMSVGNMQRVDTPGPARYRGTAGDVESLLIVVKGGPDATGNIDQAAGLWRHGNTTNQTPDNTNSGVFAWGTSSSMATLDALNAGNVSATFTGNMSGHTDTQASITVNFGSQPEWSGSWQNPAYNFDAGGVVKGVDLISTSDRFSANVQSGYVQGALLGEAGNQSVAHAVDVVLDNGGGGTIDVKDVGLLQQVP